MTVRVRGDANDYFGKGLSGAKLAIPAGGQPPLRPKKTSLSAMSPCTAQPPAKPSSADVAGERFCVRNSGAEPWWKGVGDHGCEYMTGGRVVVLGPTGRNFAAGMSGGIAYVWTKTTGWFRRFGTATGNRWTWIR
jgi:glutamate synthase (NADPH/NADH) large chain